MAWLGVDLGGTKVQGARLRAGATDELEVEHHARRPTPTGSVDDVVAAMLAVVDDLGGVDGVEAVGVGAPGLVDQRTGVVHQAPNLGWDDAVPLAALLSHALGGVEVRLDNDVNATTVAEHRMGAGRGSENLLGVSWGTGVGGGLVLDGRLRRGPSGGAGELGHLPVDPDGPVCGCGHRGHVEAFAGRASMERLARERHAHGETSALVDLAGKGRMKSGVFAKALAANDAVALRLLDDAVAALGAGIASAVTLVDLDLVVLGGGVADKLGPTVVGRVEQAARARLFSRTSPLRVVAAELGDLAGAVGAAVVARDEIRPR